MMVTAGTQVGLLCTHPPVRVPRETTLRRATRIMRAQGVSSLLVDTEPLSILTERDVVRAIADGLATTTPVSKIATSDPVWVPPAFPVVSAAALMLHDGLRHLVVRNAAGEAIGVLSMREALDIVLQSLDPSGWFSVFPALLGQD